MRFFISGSEHTKAIQERIKSEVRLLEKPNAKEYVFQKGGHTPMITYPEKYYRVVKDFLC